MLRERVIKVAHTIRKVPPNMTLQASTLTDTLRALLNDAQLTTEEEVQSLWSGYGKIIRCTSYNGTESKDYIVKVIGTAQPSSHPRGWNTSASHQRKTKSYQVEASFYQNYAKQTNSRCKVPELIAYKYTGDFALLVLEDLDHAGYFVRKEAADKHTLTLAIKWLANFHAKFMFNDAENLWPVGTYWHFSTRQDEYNKMPESAYKNNAHALDNALNNAQFKTLVHGDAKFENLCFHHQGNKVAAVDFQYVGQGSGVKDLAYLAGSCLDSNGLSQYDSFIVDEYITQLKLALVSISKEVDFNVLEQEIRYLYPIAWADFYRFLLGWNPDSWKIGDYMKTKAAQGLTHLSSKLVNDN